LAATEDKVLAARLAALVVEQLDYRATAQTALAVAVEARLFQEAVTVVTAALHPL
jgi:hypothetical protein